MSESKPRKLPWRLDPKDCGCKDGILGDSAPLSSFSGDALMTMINRVDAGYVENASGLIAEEWAALGTELRMRYATSSSHQTAGGSRPMSIKPKGEPQTNSETPRINYAIPFAVARHKAVVRALKMLDARKRELEDALSRLHPDQIPEYMRRITEE